MESTVSHKGSVNTGVVFLALEMVYRLHRLHSCCDTYRIVAARYDGYSSSVARIIVHVQSIKPCPHERIPFVHGEL
jgi:aminoglycoside phosphotransferase (APT) family kinase protein